jgi:spore coat protein CotH
LVVGPPDDSTPPRATIPVTRTSTIRAAAFKVDHLTSPVGTHSYLFADDVARQSFESTVAAGFPERWTNQLADYGMDLSAIELDNQPDDAETPEEIAARRRDVLGESLKSIAAVSLVMDIDDLFGTHGIHTHPDEKGSDWERPVSVEIIDSDSTVQLDTGIRIHGGASRRFSAKKSFRLAFRSTYGTGALTYPLFGSGAVERFDSLVLRAGYDDSWLHEDTHERAQYIRDEWSRRTQLAMGQPSPHGKFVHLCLNGVYWGLYNLVERPDASFAAAYFGGDDDDWDVIHSGDLINGTTSAWEQLLIAARQVNVSDPAASNAAYRRLLGKNPDGSRNPQLEVLLDVENYIDYMILNFYAAKYDWPCGNWIAARRRTPDSTGFKFFSWDAEYSLGLGSDIGTNRTGVDRCVAEILNHLRANREFRQLFATRVRAHFSPGGALHVRSKLDSITREPENIPAARYRELAERVADALYSEAARWGNRHQEDGAARLSQWRRIRDYLIREYFHRRASVVLEQLSIGGLCNKKAFDASNRYEAI